MSRHVSSRYLFETVGNTRTFRHQSCINNQIFECQTCHNIVGKNEPYSHHWLNVSDNQHIKLSLEEKKLLKRIELQRIQTFFLCDESARSRTNEFLLEAGIEAVPQLLRFLNYGANRLEVTIGFHVTVLGKRMYCESTPVIIGNHLDIKETVDMLFSILLEKIASFVMVNHRVPLEACAIKRIKVMVMRQMFGKPQIPLQYRVKANTN
ncbi:PREDICTED: protein terminus [Drosophila arizonae]|uniref:Protein terminus n=1 Tax=Drosophila arizonae TaxID=7263 RepID=A0ABM1Q0K3_DROAR|nr:PREDICTED: protein terminus [Drosophila arizonae]